MKRSSSGTDQDRGTFDFRANGSPIKDAGSINKTTPKQKNINSFSALHGSEAPANRPSAPASSFVVNLTATPLAVLFSHPSGLSPAAKPNDLVVGRPFSATAEPENYPCRPVSIA
jgi:hypothetical protein